MTTSTSEKMGMRRRCLPLIAATAVGALLLVACGPAGDEPAASDGNEWPDGYDFELDDPRLALGDVMQQENHADYGKLTLGESSDLTDISLVDSDVIADNIVVEGNGEQLSASLEAASRFVVEQAFDSTVLVDGLLSPERRHEWFYSVEHLFVIDEEESFRNSLNDADGTIAYRLTSERYDHEGPDEVEGTRRT